MSAPLAPALVRSPAEKIVAAAAALFAVACFEFLALEGSDFLWRHAGERLTAMQAGGAAFYLPGLVLLAGGMILLPAQASPDFTAPRLGDARGSALTAAACAAVAWLYQGTIAVVVQGGTSLPSLTPLLVSGVVFAPVVEEWIFRGLLWRSIAPAGASRGWSVAALVITSVAFGFWHLPFASHAPIAIHASFGLVMGLLRWRGGSVLAPMALHGVANFLSFVR